MLPQKLIMNYKNKIIYLIYLLPIIILGYLVWQNFNPVLEVRCDAGGKTRLCGELVPTARAEKTKDGAVIKEEPVYFDVKLPRKYDTVEAKIEYSNLKTDILEFGVARDEAKKNFDFTALENKVLDNLGWNKIEKNGLVLYQRTPAYKNISDFLSNPPKFYETLVYRADLAPKFGGMPVKGNTVIDFPVRENIKLLIYKQGGAPEIQVGAGIESDFNKIIDDLGNGLWRASLSGSKEKVFKKISIDSPYVAIADGIKIGELADGIKIFTPSSRILAQTETASGVQKILTMDIAKPFEQYAANFNDRNIKTITVPRGNIEFNGTLFFLSDKNIFYPRYEAFYSGADLSKVNFILAKYAPPISVIASPSEGAAILSVDNGIASPASARVNLGTPRNDKSTKTANAIFNITDTPTPSRKMRFLFSLPNAVKGELVNIKNIELKFSGKKFGIADLWHKLFK